jgi:hypothetical protein
VLGSTNDHFPLGLGTAFEEQKRVLLQYVVGIDSLDKLLGIFTIRYGPPGISTAAGAHGPCYFRWTQPGSKLS